MGICVRGILPCFMAEDNAEAVGLLNNESPSCGVCCAMCCWPGLCGLLGATQATGPRQAIRQRYALDGNECTDILAYWWCVEVGTGRVCARDWTRRRRTCATQRT